MNWVTRKQETVKDDSRYETCDHVKVGDRAWCVMEMDSFGPVDGVYLCQDCYDKSRQEEDEETAHCHTCGEEHKQKDLRSWRWYDFYAPQGDEPLVLCQKCWDSPTHQRRMAQDQADYAAEMGGYLWDDGDDGYY